MSFHLKCFHLLRAFCVLKLFKGTPIQMQPMSLLQRGGLDGGFLENLALAQKNLALEQKDLASCGRRRRRVKILDPKLDLVTYGRGSMWEGTKQVDRMAGSKLAAQMKLHMR